VVGDARHLPFAPGVFDSAFSYSVIQHFSKTDAQQAIDEIARVLVPGGTTKVQMPSQLGIRCLYHQMRRGFREPQGFDVRYWSLPSLRTAFGAGLGQIRFEVDGFFGIGMQPSDWDLMSPFRKSVLFMSEALRKASRVVPGLVWGADSVYVEAVKPS
jgi:SAM-dependent methyltransferase